MPSSEKREILIAHDLTRGPLRAVRRILVQSSLAELKGFGFYERYCALIDPASLAEITDQIGPGWLPIELAMAHYRACDSLELSGDQLDLLGAHAGAKLASTLLVTSAKVSPWDAIDAF